MKKHSFLFIAGALLTLASCQSDTNDNGANQAQIDSTVNARVEEMRLQMMAQNDSIINAEAQRRADSMFAEMKGSTGSRPVASSPKTTRPSAPKPTVPPKSNLPQNINDRPGGNDASRTPKNINDRPGGNDATRTPKNVDDRPGGNK